jgi:uracil-DNA glycosylase family 4
MANSGTLFDIDPDDIAPAKSNVAKKALVKRVAKTPKASAQRGCAFCPMNQAPGIRKVKGLVRLTGQKIMIWGMNPGVEENEKGLELIGKSGQFLWKELAAVGITRQMCDVQNVVRCRTPKLVTDEYGDERMVDGEPPKDVLHCCSIYTEEALRINSGRAKVHLVLGAVAAKAFLGRDYRKTEKVRWIERLNAWVICTFHPAFFLRGGTRSKMGEFRAALQSVKEISEGAGSRFSYIEKQDYKEAEPAGLKELFLELLRVADAGVRIVVDVEHGHDKTGKPVMVCVGFCYKPGVSRTVYYDHPEAPAKNKPIVLRFFKAVMENPKIRKAMHYGCTDAKEFWRLLGIRVKGFDYDTNYAEYLAYSNRWAYGLAAIAEARFPNFAGYKAIVEPFYTDPERKLWNPYTVPKKSLTVYNGADCDLTKRIELTTKKKVNPSLQTVFLHAGAVLEEMQPRGPLFDAKHHQFLETWIPKRLNKIHAKLEKLSGNPNFNVNSPKQVTEFLFARLKVQKHLPPEWHEKNKKLNTRKETMEILESFHPAPGLVAEGRRLGKKESTYMTGFHRSAELYGGRVRTKWWLTGTATGRLSSGGSKKGDEHETGLVNLQNIDGDPAIECMLVSDLRWRAIYAMWLAGHSCEEILKKFGDTDVFLGLDHSQLEMRILAQMSGDPLLIQASLSQFDLHSSVGNLLTGIPVEKIKKDREIRTVIKGLHFGIVYGLTPDNLYLHILAEAKKLGITPPDRNKILAWYNKYFQRFTKVKPFMDSQIAMAEQHGYVESLFGFKREISPYDNERSSFWKNQSMNCVDFETEALTQRGWVSGWQLKSGDVLLTMNQKTGKLEWQAATKVVRYPNYAGPVCTLSSKSFSAVTTPHHRWLVEDHGRFYERQSSTLPSGWGSIPRVGPYNGPAGKNLSDDWIRLIGWVLTDGHYGKGRGYASNSVKVCQVKKRTVVVIDELFARLAIPYRTKAKKDRKPNEEIFWSFSGLNGGWFRATFPKRILTPEFVSQLSGHQCQVLYETMLLGDGYVGSDKSGFCCKSKEGIDAFQMLALLSGSATTVRYRDMSKYKPRSKKLGNVPKMTGIWTSNTLRREKVSLGWVKRRICNAAVGMWCPMVPNTFFVARRKGHVYVTGNTPIQGTAHQLMVIALAAFRLNQKKFEHIRRLSMEVHDSLYAFVKLSTLREAYKQGVELLTTEALKRVKFWFPEIKWRIGLQVEAKAGYRLGVMQDYVGEPVAEFLQKWCEKNKKFQIELAEKVKKDLAPVAA